MAHARRIGRGHVAGGHTVHANAREGRHVAGGRHVKGQNGIVGPGKYIGAVTQLRTPPLAFIVAKSFFFFRVGLCPHGNYQCRTRGSFGDVG